MTREPRIQMQLTRGGKELVIHIPVKVILQHELLCKSAVGHLTRRQDQVLKAVLAGKCNKDIARELDIAVSTVKFHVSAMLELFDVSSRVDLVYKVLSDSTKAAQSPELLH